MNKLLTLSTVIYSLFLGKALGQMTSEMESFYTDSVGRQIIPRGFVMNTEDLEGEISYGQKDYLRAARLSANIQVIRLDMSRLGAWPGYQLDPVYLTKLDTMVALGTQQGMQTLFKMTIYRVAGPRQKNWGDFWRNENGEQRAMLDAWQRLWQRYSDNPSVFGYDLVNEPEKGDFHASYDQLQRNHLVPLYRRMIDRLQAIDHRKWALYQPILMEKNPDRAKRAIPFFEMEVPIQRDRIIYAPHIYQLDSSKILLTLSRYKKEADVSSAPLFLGEWGSATYEKTDVDLDEQQRYARAYTWTAQLADSLGIGMVKAWFLGSRWKGRNPMGQFTWAIFKDPIAVGTVERKYIVDVIARPFPSKTAGVVHAFRFDQTTRNFTMSFTHHQEKGKSEIFVGANRHYPDGFTVSIDGDWVAIYDPIDGKDLTIVKSNFEQKHINVTWDEQLQKLVIAHLPKDRKNYSLQLQPGTLYTVNK